MFQVVIIVIEGGSRVVRRINVDALHLPRVERQQRLERFEIVALKKHVAGVRIACAECGNFFQQSVRNGLGGLDILLTR